MKNSKLFALLGLGCIGGVTTSGAAAQQMMMTAPPPMVIIPQQQAMMTPQQQMMMQQQMQLQNPNQRIVGNQFIPTNTVAQMPGAAQPTRITGALPRVGSNATPTGRRYYWPSAYDRLSDSGLYIGLSAAYTVSVNGGMLADYRLQQNAWFVPGAFREAGFQQGTVIPLQLSVGAAINSDIRVDFSYTRYSGMSYPNSVQTSDGGSGFIDATVLDGGRITSTATMLNLFYNLDSYTGFLAGGALRPYVGIGVGISTNTISDYLIFDRTFYAEPDMPEGAPNLEHGWLTGISDIHAYHAGGTRENIAYMIEGGVTTQMDGGVKIDFFVRYMGLGRVSSSGSIVVDQQEWISTGNGVPIGQAGSEIPADYDSVHHYVNWSESGRLSMVDVGVRMRLQF
ncbi:MAG: hypothetical protein FWE17_00755 [Alphaproteobacteria bacterium]|nr:hypothetical protein [Alphaproteobacteria bacterium]MCL2758182.1 hypothetical protein [Alphaproteobacteria bacterium]